MVMKPATKILTKKEFEFWQSKIKLLSPKKGDILIVPAEADFDFKILAEALKHTKIIYALVVPEGNASLMEKDEALRFAKGIIEKYGENRSTSEAANPVPNDKGSSKA